MKAIWIFFLERKGRKLGEAFDKSRIIGGLTFSILLGNPLKPWRISEQLLLACSDCAQNKANDQRKKKKKNGSNQVDEQAICFVVVAEKSVLERLKFRIHRVLPLKI